MNPLYVVAIVFPFVWQSIIACTEVMGSAQERKSSLGRFSSSCKFIYHHDHQG
uniref:Uncharacterized protein n=1 Tax=Arundo donax TaxID=35708 RepID=A0A0A9ACI7_ARUDO